MTETQTITGQIPAATQYEALESDKKQAVHSSRADESTRFINRTVSVVSTMVYFPILGIARTITNTLWLANKFDSFFDYACKYIDDSTDRNKLVQKQNKIFQEREAETVIETDKGLNRSTWGDCFKIVLSTGLKVTQYTYRTLLGEVKACVTDGMDFHDHLVLSGNQLVPDHFFEALNASRANCMIFGGNGAGGVLPYESSEKIMLSKARFGILQLFYEFFC